MDKGSRTESSLRHVCIGRKQPWYRGDRASRFTSASPGQSQKAKALGVSRPGMLVECRGTLPWGRAAQYLTLATPLAQLGSFFSLPKKWFFPMTLSVENKKKHTWVRSPGPSSRAVPGQGAEGRWKGLLHLNLGALGGGTTYPDPPS